MYKESGFSLQKYCLLRGVSIGTAQEWVRHYNQLVKTGKNTFHEKAGREKAMDEAHLKKIEDKVNTLETQESHGVSGDHHNISEKSVKKYLELLHLKAVGGQSKTEARIKAEQDPRNAVSFAIMLGSKATSLSPYLLFNYDATAFCIGDNEELLIVPENLAIPPTTTSDSSIPIVIKLIHLHCAAGVPAPCVFIVSDDSMTEDQCEFFTVPGLSGVAAADNFCGFVFVMKSRSGNQTFYDHFYKSVLIPFSDRCQGIVQSIVSDF